MAEFPSYIIEHVHLDEGKSDITFSFMPEHSYYLVFWWKEIPLGHLFLDGLNEFSGLTFRKEILKAIGPAIEFYIAKQQLVIADYKDSFLNNNEPEFAAIMDKILSGCVPFSLPAILNISVVICTRNRSNSLQHCLESIQSQKCLPAEIIVVDNAPVDDSTSKIVAKFDGVTYCLEPKPGLDIARNTGARKASFPVVAYVDDDVLVHPLWTYRVWEIFNEPGISAMTGLVIASSLDTEAQQIFEKYWSFNRGYRDKFYDAAFIKVNLAVWEIGAGANMAFRKSLFEEVGYFDERLDVGAAGCSGDSELWYRILVKGHNILYCPKAVVYHSHRKEISALKKQLFNYMRGFAAAALIQQSQNESAGYKKHLYRVLPIHYLHQLASGFPGYGFQYRTLFSEITGLISGIRFFRKHRKKPSQTHPV